MNCAFIQFLGIFESIYQITLFSTKTSGHTSDEGTNIHLNKVISACDIITKPLKERLVKT